MWSFLPYGLDNEYCVWMHPGTHNGYRAHSHFSMCIHGWFQKVWYFLHQFSFQNQTLPRQNWMLNFAFISLCNMKPWMRTELYFDFPKTFNIYISKSSNLKPPICLIYPVWRYFFCLSTALPGLSRWMSVLESHWSFNTDLFILIAPWTGWSSTPKTLSR